MELNQPSLLKIKNLKKKRACYLCEPSFLRDAGVGMSSWGDENTIFLLFAWLLSSSDEHGQRRDDILTNLPIKEQDQQRPWGPVSSRERWGEKGAFSQKELFSLPLSLRIRTVGVQSSMGVADRAWSPCWGSGLWWGRQYVHGGKYKGAPIFVDQTCTCLYWGWATLTFASWAFACLTLSQWPCFLLRIGKAVIEKQSRWGKTQSGFSLGASQRCCSILS